MRTFEKVLIDHNYLWKTYDQAEDSACMDEEAGKLLLQNPTKDLAKRILINRIRYWFDVGPEDKTRGWLSDPVIQEMVEDYCCEVEYNRHMGA